MQLPWCHFHSMCAGASLLFGARRFGFSSDAKAFTAKRALSSRVFSPRAMEISSDRAPSTLSPHW